MNPVSSTLTSGFRADEQPESLLRAVLDSPSVAVLVVDEDGRIRFLNRTVEQLFGYSPAELSGQPLEVLVPEQLRSIHAAHRRGFFSRPRERGMGPGLDLMARRRDGTEFPVEVSLSYISTDQGILAVAFLMDISLRKQAEGERDSYFNLSPDPLCIRTSDGNFRRVNPAMIALLGRSEAELCSTSYVEFLHPDDRERTSAAIRGVFQGHPMEYFVDRYRSKNGNWRWLQWRTAMPHAGAAICYAAARDVTEAKTTQEKLRHLARKVMTAHEEERRRIARDLHDDITQRLATLGIEMGLLRKACVEPVLPDLLKELSRLQAEVLDLSEDIRKLSHSLHPSILEHADLAAGLKALCSGFKAQHGIAATVETRDVPEGIPRAVAVAFYRIAQESLRNAARHSGATEVSVTLGGDSGTHLWLHIIDNGRGFDVGQTASRPGLGLIGIEERARGMGGVFTVASLPGAGTRLSIRVPLAATEETRAGET